MWSVREPSKLSPTTDTSGEPVMCRSSCHRDYAFAGYEGGACRDGPCTESALVKETGHILKNKQTNNKYQMLLANLEINNGGNVNLWRQGCLLRTGKAERPH